MNISAQGNYHYGNPFLARLNRLKRKRRGFAIEYTDNHLASEKNPFGNNSIVDLWNEDVVFKSYLNRLHPLQRDSRGRWVKPDTEVVNA